MRGVTAQPLRLGALLLALACAHPAAAAPSEGATETVEQALCRLIDDSAKARGLPVPFLTRLIWRESSFRVGVVSPAGAQGVAQFMPGTARERGLLDPFDPEQAIPHAAHLLADLRTQFGNLGLAAAAYNGGAARVSKWLAGDGGLPAETRAYVAAITGRPVDDWRTGPAKGIEFPEGGAPAKPESKPEGKDAKDQKDAKVEVKPDAPQTCLQVTASLRVPSRGDRFALGLNEGPAAPWGIQLAGNFSKALALQSFNRARSAYVGVIGEVRPMIIGTRLRNRGTRAFYRIRIPAQSRQAADDLCGRIRKVGGACIVLRT
ncbi:lytic transglycosylase domain-containing protein [Methylobacterium radiotolerans]|uniref:lytic transglycosylase domain-containing protein n=1 Tax=Methylobacterium radiotolerans TaxID=31998 RepID=UPI000D5DC317|nr:MULTISPECIES: lytic transglycosylase domain-containing protein [Methylobacterium]MDE3745338.1 lytic transglycosylase domain-containing protein [Methylobacterium radiotolerans]PVY97247.1 sporulation related protein [Methylobacterium organophilum]